MIVRKLAAGVLALPVVVATYVGAVGRSPVARVALGLVVLCLVSIAALGLLVPGGAATPPAPIEPVPAALFSPMLVDRALDAPMTFTFSAPMDRASVEAAVDVAPPTPVRLSWDAEARTLTVRPATNWAAATGYDITVGASATSATGRRLGAPVHAIFLTRQRTVGALAVPHTSGGLVRADAVIGLTFQLPVQVASVQAGFTVVPPVAGTLRAVAPGTTSSAFVFVPAAPLAGSTTYRIAVGGAVVDADGGLAAPVDPLSIRTVPPPVVAASRPSDRATGVGPSAPISITFTVPMDRKATAAAFSVSRSGARVAGSIAWSDRDTTLTFRPSANLPAGAALRVAVAAAARSAEGAALGHPFGIGFTVAKPPPTPRPKPAAAPAHPATRPAPRPTPRPAPTPVAPPSGGGAAGSAPWHAVETYYLRLLNCTRTGGWVTSGGACGSVPAGLTVRSPTKALFLDAGISDRVTRPYAKYLAINGLCNHFYDGSPADRLRRAGYPSYRWAENIGCPSGDPYAGMIAVERFFQNETPSGGHYVNLMNPLYDRAGVGVWVSSSRVRVVIDFYHP